MDGVQPCPLKKAVKNTVCNNQLKKLFPGKSDRDYADIIKTMDDYGIHTLENQSHFLGQIAHESNDLINVRELKFKDKEKQLEQYEKYQKNPDLHNTQPGDGEKFIGRGYMQLTGRGNYQRFADEVRDPEIMLNPDLVAKKYPIQVAAWFWKDKKLNRIDSLDDESIYRASKSVNGNFSGTIDEFYECSEGKSDAMIERRKNELMEQQYYEKYSANQTDGYKNEKYKELLKNRQALLDEQVKAKVRDIEAYNEQVKAHKEEMESEASKISGSDNSKAKRKELKEYVGKAKKALTAKEQELKRVESRRDNLPNREDKVLLQQASLYAKSRNKLEAKQEFDEEKRNNNVNPIYVKRAEERAAADHAHLVKQADRIKRTKKMHETLSNKSLCEPDKYNALP